MKLHEQALLYLDKAAEDEVLVDEVIASPRVSDAVIGFHCQQAVEKLLKALLSHVGVRFRKTHDLRELLDLLADHGAAPSHYLQEFIPYLPLPWICAMEFCLWEERLPWTARKLAAWFRRCAPGLKGKWD
jgi:HEPN domain-containing protein